MNVRLVGVGMFVAPVPIVLLLAMTGSCKICLVDVVLVAIAIPV